MKNTLYLKALVLIFAAHPPLSIYKRTGPRKPRAARNRPEISPSSATIGGIAHVYGKTDAVFGIKYAQAEDGLNRVETNYITSLGRLAEAEGRVPNLPGFADEALH
jgi:acyl-homoserine lactone acylase PvdQ